MYALQMRGARHKTGFRKHHRPRYDHPSLPIMASKFVSQPRSVASQWQIGFVKGSTACQSDLQ